MYALFPPVPAIIMRLAPLLILALSIWVTGRAAERTAPRFGISPFKIAGLTPGLAIVSIASARLATVAPNWRSIVSHPLDLLRITDGLSFTAGAIGGIAAASVFAWKSRCAALAIIDLYAAVLPLGLAVSSAGCLLREDCFGRVAPSPIGIVFPGFTVARYPVELYASAGFFILFALLNGGGFRANPPGFIALGSIAAVGWIEFSLDRLRLHTHTGSFAGDHLLTIVMALGATAMLIVWRWAQRPGVNGDILLMVGRSDLGKVRAVRGNES